MAELIGLSLVSVTEQHKEPALKQEKGLQHETLVAPQPRHETLVAPQPRPAEVAGQAAR